MRPRVLFSIFAFASLSAAFAGFALQRGAPHPGDGGHVLIAGLMALGFALAAWIEGPAPRRAGARCHACGQGALLNGMGFCGACGADAGRPLVE